MNREGTKKKAAPVLEHQGGQDKVGATAWQAGASPCNDTTVKPPGQGFRVADLLLRGQENALPLKHLKGLLHADGRTVRRQIEVERRRGIPILSNCRDGYFLPDSDSEKAQCVRSMRGRAAEILKTAAAIEAGGNETE